MLTGKQHQLLSYLIDYQADKDITPSFDEMRQAVGLASKSGVHRLVSALEERGYIRRLPNRARAIEILRHPGSPASADGPSSNVVEADFTESLSSVIALPLLGRIAAGTPIEALSDPSSYLDVPAGLVAGGDHFALEIVGDLMVDAGIHDGDTVIIRRAETASSGEIVVALIEDSEATLKTFRREAGRVALEPANAAYETRYFSTDKVRIQGRLTGLIRRY